MRQNAIKKRDSLNESVICICIGTRVYCVTFNTHDNMTKDKTIVMTFKAIFGPVPIIPASERNTFTSANELS